MKEKKKRNKSVFGVIQFIFDCMERKDKSKFILLAIFYSFSGIFMLIPAQILAMIISYVSEQPIYFFGFPISVNINLYVFIGVCGLLALIPSILKHFMGFVLNNYILKVYMQCKQTAFEWATTPRKNLDLGMTIGDATYRINDSIADIDWTLSCLFETILPSIFSAIISAVYICLIDVYSLPILLVGLILVVITFLIRQKVENPITQAMELRGARITNFLVNTLGNLTIVNLFNSKNFENNNLKNKVDDYRGVCKKRYRIWSVYWIVMVTIDIVSTYLVILVASSRVVNGILSAGDIVLIISYVGKVFSPIQDFGWFINTNTQLYTKILRLKVLKPTKETMMDISHDNYSKPIEKIELKNVTIRNDDNVVIENLNYTLEKGKLTVVTGTSGGGKTTSLRALVGIAERETGDIIINDEYKAHSMYYFVDRMSVVMQSPFIFNRDVKSNVYYPDLEPNSRSKEIVKNLGLGTIINRKFDEDKEQEMELKLSGGEKKRICVLRGLLQQKEVYIFDEPTNELDAENTEIVLDYINQLKSNAIVMVVTHDKRMIDRADKVVKINNAKRSQE